VRESRTLGSVGAKAEWLSYPTHDPLARTAHGERIRWETIAGRTAAWVPAIQR